MTAAAVCGTDGVVSQHWCRTVYFRQGRFFVVSVTVRTPAYLPLRSAFPRVYTTGRFTVREELLWLGLQDEQPQDAASLCMPHSCSGITTALNLAAACSQAEQLQVQQGLPAQAGSACDEVHLSRRQHGQMIQEQSCTCAPGQQQQGADAGQQARPWWSRLFTAARRGVSADKAGSPAAKGAVPDGSVKVSCLQLGFSWPSCLRKTLASIASTVRRPAFCRRCYPKAAVAAQEPADAATPEAAAVGGLELAGKPGHAAGKPVQVVQIDVIGYPLRL